MGDPGPSSGRLPFLEPNTSSLLSAMFASSVPTQSEAIMTLASTNTMAPPLAFNGIQVTYPLPQANGVLSVRIETRIKLLVSFLPGSPIQFLEVPKTQSVKKGCDNIPEHSLKFSLELKGAGNQTIIRTICPKCEKRKGQATSDIVDFRAETTIVTIDIENGAASFEFSIKCYPFHYGIENFCADAVLRDYHDNVINLIQLPLLFDIKGKAKQPANPRKALGRAVRGVSAQQRSITPAVPLPARDNGQTSDSVLRLFSPPASGNGGQQPSSVDTTAEILPVVDAFFWDIAPLPVNAPPLNMTSTLQHAVRPSELGFNLLDTSFLHLVDTLPLESNSDPVVYSGTRTSAPPHGEQVLPVVPCENASIPSSLGPTSGEPHCRRSINQASRVPETTSQMLSQNSSGTSQAPNTSSGVPSGQGTSPPDISTPPESSRLQAGSSIHTRNEGVDQITLEEVVPDKGPITGMIPIVLFGENFPAGPLYVLFGYRWARAARYDARILRCLLPPSPHPGVVDVTLSQTPSRDAPEVGSSIATFEYVESRPQSLLSLLKTIYQWVDETTRQMGPTQSFSTMNTHRNPSLNTRTTHSNGNQEREEIPTRLEMVNLEDISVHFLRTYSTQPNWKQIVSTCNDYGQTLAHIAVTFGYLRLLQHLIRWEIDLDAVDSTGSTALHYAYLFQQEECARFLIHSGVDQFILDDLGCSPSDLDPSLEVRIRSNMDMDSDSSADGAPPIECDTEMPDEAGKLYAKHFLIQQWMLQGENERRGEVPVSRCQSQETSPASPDSTDEKIWGVTYDRSSSLDLPPPEEHSTPVIAEEIDVEALIEIVTPPHMAHPPSPVSELSPQTQEVNRPSNTGQSLFSHPTPLGGVIRTLDLDDPQIYRQLRAVQPLADCEPSLVSTARQGHLRLSDTGDITEQNDVYGEKLLQRSSSRPESTGVAIPTSPGSKQLRRSPQSARPSASHQRSTPGSHIEPTDAIALDNARKDAWKLVSMHHHGIEPSIRDPAAIDIVGSAPIETPVDALPFMTSTSHHAVQPSELGSGHNMGSFHHLDSLPLESNNNPVTRCTSAQPHSEQILPVMSCENAPVPRSPRSNLAEPHCARRMGQASRVTEVTSQVLSQNSSGTPQAPNTSSAVPSGQEGSAPDISVPSETSRLQTPSPVPTRNEGIDQTTDEALLEEVIPQSGPMTGGVLIFLFGQNFPSGPLYVRFGDNWARAFRQDARILQCVLPPTSHPRIVDVKITQSPHLTAPEVGQSTATFEYQDSGATALLAILKNIYQRKIEATPQRHALYVPLVSHDYDQVWPSAGLMAA